MVDQSTYVRIVVLVIVYIERRSINAKNVVLVIVNMVNKRLSVVSVEIIYVNTIRTSISAGLVVHICVYITSHKHYVKSV